MGAAEGVQFDNQLVIEYVERRSILGNVTDKSAGKYYLAVGTLLRVLHNRGKTLETLEENDALALIQILNKLKTKREELFTEETKYDYWSIWKAFTKYAYKKHGTTWNRAAYETISEYTYQKDPNKQKKKSSFTRSERNHLIDLEPSLMWKVYLIAIFDGGMRPGESMPARDRTGVRLRDVTLYEDGTLSIYIAKGKTGPRMLWYVGESARALAQWKCLHPYNDNPDAPFFLNEALKPIQYKAAEVRFKKLVKKAGFYKEKPCLYSARISAVTDSAEELPDEMLCKKFGWAPGSKMPQKYVRQSGLDLKAAEQEAHRRRTSAREQGT